MRLPADPTPTRRGRKVLAAAGAVVVVVGGLAVHAAAGPSGADGYRTATVRTDDVDQTLEGVGTVEPVTQAAVAFPVAGTVATVGVKVGDAVTVGQVLATLDPSSLQSAIDIQQAAVDQAELVLANARSSASSATTTSTTTAATGGRGSGGAASAAVDADVLAAQQAVLTDQRAVDDRLQTAQEALDSAARICAAAQLDPSPDPDASTTTTAPSDDDGVEGGAPEDGATTPDPSAIEACRTALQDVLVAQQAVSDAQATLAKDASAYDAALDARAQTIESDAASAAAATPSASASGAGARTGSSGGVASAADLIKDQKEVDAAEAQLAVAQQALQQATIASPIDGTVAAVGLAAGDAVTAGSTTATIVVVGQGGFEVTMTVAVAKLPQVALGQPATVRPDGADDSLDGKVVGIGVASTSSTGATTYPVTIGLSSDGAGLRNGSVAGVTVVTKAASGAVVVPTSAVHTQGATHTVEVLDGSTVKAVTIEVGAMGSTWTEVTRGLTVGQEVVLADLGAALPTSATQASTGNRNGGTGIVRFGGFQPGAFAGRRVAG